MRLTKAKKLIEAYEALSRIDRVDRPFKFAEAAKEFFDEYGVDAYYMIVNEMKVLQEMEVVRKEAKALAKQREKNAELLNKQLSEANFSSKTGNLLLGIGVETIGDILKYSEADLVGTPNFGVKTINEIKEFLKNHGYKLA